MRQRKHRIPPDQVSPYGGAADPDLNQKPFSSRLETDNEARRAQPPPLFEIGTIKDACAVIGGSRPCNAATFYRGVKSGRYNAPFHPSPGLSRVDLAELRDRIRREMEASKT